MPDYYSQAVDAAVAEAGRPLAELSPVEQEATLGRAIGFLISWGVFREDRRGKAGDLIREANRARED